VPGKKGSVHGAKVMARTPWNVRVEDGVIMHPGGRKVLEAVEAALGLQREAFAHAWQVLANYGNMSSPTAPCLGLALRSRLRCCTYWSRQLILVFAVGR
jgi:predicted naringenin-chalcone synthase